MHQKKQIKKLIIRYLSGEANPDEIRILTDWVQSDSESRAHYEQVRNIWEMSHPAFPPEKIDVEKAHIDFMRFIRSRKWYQSTFIRYWQYTAAILLLPLFITIVYLVNERPDVLNHITYQEVFSPYGTHSKVILPDNSIAWLNAGSSLKYPTIFTEGERNVYLSGEAYFEVQSDKSNPFIVETGKLKVCATGTEFNVEAYEKDSIISVTMVEGLINIIIGDKEPFTMTPRERMAYNRNQSKYKVNKTDPYKWYAWKDNMMIFRDDPLEYVFKKIGQTFNVEIAVKDTDIANQLYRATFEDESLDEILRLLQLTAPIRYTHFKREKGDKNQYERQKIEVHKITKK